MHQLIKDHLEEILEGRRDSSVEAHLAACQSCRETVAMMTDQSAMLHTLRAPEGELDQAPGFYARVMQRIEPQDRPSIWDTLLDPIFGKRLVYASLALVLLMGTYLAFTGPAPRQIASSPEVIMAAPVTETAQALGSDPQRDRETVLVTLTAYGE